MNTKNKSENELTPAKVVKRQRIGWYFYDWANSAFPTTVITLFLGPYLTNIADKAAGNSELLNVFGVQIAAGSFYPYAVSLSVILQVFLLPILGAIADYTDNKKLFLGVFAYLGSIATMGLYFLEGTNYMLGGTLFIVANICFGASMVMYNAFLNDISEPQDRDRVSSKGWAFGYLGGGTLLLLNLFFYLNAESFGIDKSYAVRLCLSSAGLWWAIFTIIPMIMLKVKKQTIKKLGKQERVISVGFKQLIETVKSAKKYPKTLYFLVAYLFYNDGVQAVIALAAQFGQEELGIALSDLTTVILIVQFVAFFGAHLFNQIAQRTDTKIALQISLIIWILAIIYSFLVLKTAQDFMFLGAVIGLVMGGSQALSRSLFSKLIPKGKAAEYFSLYEVSERGSSWFAPFIFGLTYQFTGSYRFAILSLIVFFIIGFIMLIPFNMKKGMAEVNR